MQSATLKGFVGCCVFKGLYNCKKKIAIYRWLDCAGNHVNLMDKVEDTKEPSPCIFLGAIQTDSKFTYSQIRQIEEGIIQVSDAITHMANATQHLTPTANQLEEMADAQLMGRCLR